MCKVNEEKIIKEWEERRKPYAVAPWTDSVNSTPIQDLRSWQKCLGDFAGTYGDIIELNYKTFKLICDSQEPQKLWEEDIRIPSDLNKFLWSNSNILINDRLEDGKVNVKVNSKYSEYLPDWYRDIEAEVGY